MKKFSTTDIIIFVGSLILIFVILYVIVSNNPRIFEATIETASSKTKIAPTRYEIYDKSPDSETCDRLIIVQPFYWHIWAYSGSVYLLNESNKTCPINYTPCVVVPTNKSDNLSDQIFKDVCINADYNTIVKSYTDTIIPVVIPFDVKSGQRENEFTILDALNFLFTKYITQSKPEESNVQYSNEKINRDKIIKYENETLFNPVNFKKDYTLSPQDKYLLQKRIKN